MKGYSSCKVCGVRFSYDGAGRIRTCRKCLLKTVKCKCGCGEEAPKYNPLGKLNKGYCSGHYSRTPEHKRKFDINRNRQGMRGRQHSKETKQKMSLARQGSKNANWKGGLTRLVRGIRRSPEFHQWRKAVLRRDNYTCRDCGATGELNAHHILSLIDYPDRVFDINNGLTLCAKCHKRYTWWQRKRRK